MLFFGAQLGKLCAARLCFSTLVAHALELLFVFFRQVHAVARLALLLRVHREQAIELGLLPAVFEQGVRFVE